MKFITIFLIFTFMINPGNTIGQSQFESDVINTSNGTLKMTFIGHGTLMFEYNDKVIHIDPVGSYADYRQLPDADLILITHEHGDHLDPDAIREIRQPDTKIICTTMCSEELSDVITLHNGDTASFLNVHIEAVPAYNIVHKRSNSQPFHPKGVGNGYVLTFGDKKIYVAGDTENIPEMGDLKDIYCAFLPMNLPYTMDPPMVVDAVNKIKPAILYPYHYGNTNVNDLLELIKDNKSCEVRIRKLN